MTSGPAPDCPVRVVIVDDQALVRAGFRMVLDAHDDLAVVGEAANGREALDVVAASDPDIVLMDIRMPLLDGIGATAALAQRGDRARVIVLTTFDLDDHVHAALRAGASGFLLKDAGPQDLLSAIHAVHRGDSVIAPSATRRMVEHFLAAAPAVASPVVAGRDPLTERDQALPSSAQEGGIPARLEPLTPRELEILGLVGRGLTNGEICAELFLAEATVKTHVGRILHKLGLRDRVQMVLLAYDTGLVRPGS